MWIIPKNLGYSQFAPVTEESNMASALQDLNIESRLFWRSKPFAVQTWLKRWKSVPYVQHLFGRILKPSMQNHFVDWWTSSLVDIHVNHSPQLVQEQEWKTQGTFGRIFSRSSVQLDLFTFSSKMSKDTSHLDSMQWSKTFKELVILLRSDYSRRKKQAQATREKESSSWENWPTPTVVMSETDQDKFKARQKRLKENNKGRTGNGCGPSLSQEVRNWPTPDCSDRRSKKKQATRSEQFSGELANTNSIRKREMEQQKPESNFFDGNRAPIARPGQQQYDWEEPRANTKRALKSRLGLSADGYDYRTDFLRALGNGVDPWTAKLAFETLMYKINKNQ